MAKRRISKKERERIEEVLLRLDKEYTTEVRCYLDHDNPWQLLIATILSAQCTDARVNIVTKDLFRKYTSLEDFAHASQSEMEKDVHSTGFYRNKAKNIIACTRRLIEEYNGEVPREIEDLVTLPGVGRKTANVIRGNIYNEPSIVVDTHVKRISKRLGFTKYDEPVKIEMDLMGILPRENWIRYNIQIIMLGRTICTSRSRKCEECFLYDICPSCLLPIERRNI